MGLKHKYEGNESKIVLITPNTDIMDSLHDTNYELVSPEV